MPARTYKLSVCVACKHLVTRRKASLIGVSIRRVWALQHQTGVQHSATEWNKAKVAVRRVMAPALHLDSANRLRSPTRVFIFFSHGLKVLAKRESPIQLYTKVGWCGGNRKGTSFNVDCELTSCLPVVKVESCCHRFVCAKLQFSFLEIRG